VKFGTAAGTWSSTLCQISRWEADIWGLPAPKKCEKLPKLPTFFSPTGANPLPDVGEIRTVYAG